MLRPTLSRWLERKSVRPVMCRMGRSAGLSSYPSASPGYHSGDVDDFAVSDSLDLMDDTPIEPLGRSRQSIRPTQGSGRVANAQEMLTRLEQKYHLPPAGVQSGAAGEHNSEEWREQRPVVGSARRVMSTPRRPHSHTPATVVLGETDGRTGSVYNSPGRAAVTSHPAGHTTAVDNGSGDADSAQESSTPTQTGEAEETAETGASPAAAKSTDAYRFLLNHIDAEIAALRRRHSSVTTRHQNVQTRQTQRIRELFELIEAPWMLLPTEVQPALPATGVDVYIKEQQLARQKRLNGSNSSNNAAGHDGQEKMYVLALHKNYKSMPAGRKRFYEEAANYNAAVREEMKYQLTRGCTRFEAFLDRVKECTMEMAREGQMPELPSGHAQQRFHALRGTPGNRYDGVHRTQAFTEAAGESSRGRRLKSHVGREGENGHGVLAAEEAEDGDIPDESPTTVSSKAIKAKGKRAYRRIKDTAKTSVKSNRKASTAAESSADAGPALSKNGRGKGGRRVSAHTKATQSVKVPKGKKRTTAATGGKKSSGGAGASRSIPLPNLNHLAMKKSKQLAAPLGKKKTAAEAVKASKTKATGGKSKKR